MDKLETMRAFTAVALDGSFTAAARRLGISTKLASKRVQQLEASLATQLFNRTTRSVSLTDVGTAFLERCRPSSNKSTSSSPWSRSVKRRSPVRYASPRQQGLAASI